MGMCTRDSREVYFVWRGVGNRGKVFLFLFLFSFLFYSDRRRRLDACCGANRLGEKTCNSRCRGDRDRQRYGIGRPRPADRPASRRRLYIPRSKIPLAFRGNLRQRKNGFSLGIYLK